MYYCNLINEFNNKSSQLLPQAPIEALPILKGSLRYTVKAKKGRF